MAVPSNFIPHFNEIQEGFAAAQRADEIRHQHETNNRVLQATTTLLKHTNNKAMADQQFNTRLDDRDERAYQAWKQHIPNHMRAQEGVYDLRGYYIHYANNPDVRNPDMKKLPETWKKPNHPEFSKFSIYSDQQTPGGEYRKMKGKDGKDHTFFMPPEALAYEKDLKWKQNQDKHQQSEWDPYSQGSGFGLLGGIISKTLRNADEHLAQMTPEQKKEELYKLRKDPMKAVGGHTKVNERSWYGAIGASVPAGVLSTMADVFDIASKVHVNPQNAFGLLDEPKLNKSRYVSEFFRGLSEEVQGKVPTIKNKLGNIAEQAAVGAGHLAGEIMGLNPVIDAGKAVAGLTMNAIKFGIAARGAEMLAGVGEVVPKAKFLYGAGKTTAEAAETFSAIGHSKTIQGIEKVGKAVLKHTSDPMDWAFVMTNTSKHTNELYDTVNDLVKHGVPKDATPEEQQYYQSLLANKDKIKMDGYANLLANSLAFMGLGKAALLQKMMRPLTKEFGADATSKWLTRHLTEQFGPEGMLSKLTEGAEHMAETAASAAKEGAQFAMIGAIPSITDAIVQNSLFNKKIDMKQELTNVGKSFATGAFMGGIPKLITGPEVKIPKAGEMRKEVSPVVEATYEAANMAGAPEFTRMDTMKGYDQDPAVQGTKEHIRQKFGVDNEAALDHITSYLFKAKDDVKEVLEQTQEAKSRTWQQAEEQLQNIRPEDSRRLIRKAHEAERMMERRFNDPTKPFEEKRFNEIFSLYMRGEKDAKAVERIHDTLYDIVHLNEATKTLNAKMEKLDIDNLDPKGIDWFVKNSSFLSTLSNESIYKEVKSRIGEDPFTNPDADVENLPSSQPTPDEMQAQQPTDPSIQQQDAAAAASEGKNEETEPAEPENVPTEGIDHVIAQVKDILPQDGDVLARKAIDSIERNIAAFVGLEDSMQPREYEDKIEDLRYTIYKSDQGFHMEISDFAGNNQQEFDGSTSQDIMQSYANYLTERQADKLGDPTVLPPLADHGTKEDFLERAQGGLLRGTPKRFETAVLNYQRTANRTWEKVNSLTTPDGDLQGKLEISKNWQQVVHPESRGMTQSAINEAMGIMVLNDREERKRSVERLKETDTWTNIVANLPLYINARIGNIFINDGHANEPMTPEYQTARSNFLEKWLVDGNDGIKVRRIYGDFDKGTSRSLKERASFMQTHPHSFEKIEDDFHQAMTGRYTLDIAGHKMEVFRSKMGYDEHTGKDPGLSGPLAALIVDNAINDNNLEINKDNQTAYGIKLPTDKPMLARDIIGLFLEPAVLETPTPVSADHIAKGYMQNTNNYRDLADQFIQINPNQINYYYEGAYRSESIQNMPREDLIPIVESILKKKGIFPAADKINQPQPGLQIGNVKLEKGKKLSAALVDNDLLHTNLDIQRPFSWATVEVTTADNPITTPQPVDTTDLRPVRAEEVEKINKANTKGGIIAEADVSSMRDELGDVPIRLYKSSNQNPYLTCNERLLQAIDGLNIPEAGTSSTYVQDSTIVRNQLMEALAGRFTNRDEFQELLANLSQQSDTFKNFNDALYGVDGDENLRTAAMSFFNKERSSFVSISKDWRTGAMAVAPASARPGELFVNDGMGDKRYVVHEPAAIDRHINTNLKDRVYVDRVLKDPYFSHNQTLTRLRDDKNAQVAMHEVISIDTASGKTNYGKLSNIDRAVLVANHALDITKPAVVRQISDKDRLFLFDGLSRRNMKTDGSEAPFFLSTYGKDERTTVLKEIEKRRDVLRMLLGDNPLDDNMAKWASLTPEEQHGALAGRSLKGMGLIGGYHYDYVPMIGPSGLEGWKIDLEGGAYHPRLFGSVWGEDYYTGLEWDNMTAAHLEGLRNSESDIVNDDTIGKMNAHLAILEDKYLNDLAAMGLVKLGEGKKSAAERLLSVATTTDGKPYIGLDTDPERFLNNVKRIILHNLHNQLELNGLLFGDPALFGSWGNQTKRIGQAFSTGTAFVNDFPAGHELADRKTYKSLSVHDMFFHDKEGYDALATLRASTGLDASSLKGVLDSMPTDGQSFMTPAMAREMEIRLGRWSEVKEDIYKHIKKGEDVGEWGHRPLFTVMKCAYWGDEMLGGKTGTKIAKTSYKTLLPDEYPTLQPLVKWMDKNDIGVLHFGSAIKSWNTDRAELFDNNGIFLGTDDLNDNYVSTHSWDNLRWQLPMDIHPIRERGLSVQLIKTLSDDVALHPIINKMSERKALDMEDERIPNKLVFYGARPTNATDNVLHAAEDGASVLAFKGLGKLRSSISGLAATVRTDLQGGAFVRTAAVGRQDLRYMDEHGLTEAVVNPSTLANIMPHGIPFSMQKQVFEKIKSDLGGAVELLVHRTPLNGLQSAAKCNIKDLSTESTGQNIQLPHIMTSILGDDNDGDKLFFAMPYFKWIPVGDVKGKWYPDAEAKNRFDEYTNSRKIVHDEEDMGLGRVKDQITYDKITEAHRFAARDGTLLYDDRRDTFYRIIPGANRQEKIGYFLDNVKAVKQTGDHHGALGNAFLAQAFDYMDNPQGLISRTSPVDAQTTHVKDLISKYSTLYEPFGLEQISPMAAVKEVDFNLGGQEVISTYALANSLKHLKDRYITTPDFSSTKFKWYDGKMNHEYSFPNLIKKGDRTINMQGGFIADDLGAMLSLAVDASKDPIMLQGNNNTITANAIATLLLNGYGDSASLIAMTPVIRDYVDAVNAKKFSGESYRNPYIDTFEKYARAFGYQGKGGLTAFFDDIKNHINKVGDKLLDDKYLRAICEKFKEYKESGLSIEDWSEKFKLDQGAILSQFYIGDMMSKEVSKLKVFNNLDKGKMSSFHDYYSALKQLTGKKDGDPISLSRADVDEAAVNIDGSINEVPYFIKKALSFVQGSAILNDTLGMEFSRTALTTYGKLLRSMPNESRNDSNQQRLLSNALHSQMWLEALREVGFTKDYLDDMYTGEKSLASQWQTLNDINPGSDLAQYFKINSIGEDGNIKGTVKIDLREIERSGSEKHFYDSLNNFGTDKLIPEARVLWDRFMHDYVIHSYITEGNSVAPHLIPQDFITKHEMITNASQVFANPTDVLEGKVYDNTKRFLASVKNNRLYDMQITPAPGGVNINGIEAKDYTMSDGQVMTFTVEPAGKTERFLVAKEGRGKALFAHVGDNKYTRIPNPSNSVDADMPVYIHSIPDDISSDELDAFKEIGDMLGTKNNNGGNVESVPTPEPLGESDTPLQGYFDPAYDNMPNADEVTAYDAMMAQDETIAPNDAIPITITKTRNMNLKEKGTLEFPNDPVPKVATQHILAMHRQGFGELPEKALITSDLSFSRYTKALKLHGIKTERDAEGWVTFSYDRTYDSTMVRKETPVSDELRTDELPSINPGDSMSRFLSTVENNIMFKNEYRDLFGKNGIIRNQAEFEQFASEPFLAHKEFFTLVSSLNADEAPVTYLSKVYKDVVGTIDGFTGYVNNIKDRLLKNSDNQLVSRLVNKANDLPLDDPYWDTLSHKQKSDLLDHLLNC